jgi:integrase
MRLTTATIKTLALPAGVGEKTFFDDELPGFGLRLRAGGAARFVVQYDLGQKTRRMTLGALNVLDLGAARKSAKDILAAVRLGRDPAGIKIEARAHVGETFGALLARYLPYKRTQLKAGSRSIKEVERHLLRYARPLHAHPVAAILRRDIAALMSAIASKNGATAANCMLGSLSGYCNWLIREGLIEGVNPAAYVNKAAQSRGRERVLTSDEFREIWNALGDSDYADIVKLLTYTSARKTEIGGLRWDEIDVEAAEINLPASRCKNNKPHTIPLVPQALAILKARAANGREFVFGYGQGFTGWAWAKAALDERIAAARKAAGIKAPMPSWVLHDLRRFFSTVAHDKLGVAPHIVEAALGHVSGFKSGVSGVYNKATYIDERRRALAKWAAFIDESVSGKKPAIIVRLKRK